MKMQTRPFRIARIFIYSVGVLLVTGIAGYFIGQSIVRKKIAAAIAGLPATLRITYSSIDPGLLTGSLGITDLKVIFTPGPDSLHRHEVSLDRLSVRGIDYFSLLSSHSLHIRSLRLEGCQAALDDWLLNKDIPMPRIQEEPPFRNVTLDRLELVDITATARRENKEERKKGADAERKKHDGERSEVVDKGRPEGPDEGRPEGRETLFFEGSLTIDSIHLNDIHQPIDTGNVHFGAIRLRAKDIRYVIPGAYERVRLKNIELSSKEGSLHIDTIRIAPTVAQEEAGKLKGVQVDCVEGISEGIAIEGLNVRALLRHRLTASTITIHRNNLHVFRDRRLPREEGEKPMPMEYLKALPVTIRVRSVKFGTTNFAYEEFPKKWDKTGTLRIVRLTGTLSPLINHPVEGDPAYLTMKTEGSLMGSGTVTATTMLPLHKGDPYKVEGAFHELDVTALNNSAENLGRIHLESGILNFLAFQFDMTDERSTGKIVGEYHHLVVDKLMENTNDIKVNKLKSFALKKFIIPPDKDRTLPESKRTGKVDYKRDRSRYFSYYLLHSLLVGIKKSFALGFLLPG
jgi:hypothetical protein